MDQSNAPQTDAPTDAPQADVPQTDDIAPKSDVPAEYPITPAEYPITAHIPGENSSLIAGIRASIVTSLRYEDLPDGSAERRMIAALVGFLDEVKAVSPLDYDDAVMTVGTFAMALRSRMLPNADPQHA